MYVNNTTSWAPYILKCKLDWYTDNPLTVKVFSYTLTQYTPSVFANIVISIDRQKFKDFMNIESLPIEQRKVEVWFESELYNKMFMQSFFAGPYKFCITDYTFAPSALNEAAVDLKSTNEPMAISLRCVDEVFYKMTLNQKFNSFGECKTSEVVEKIVSSNGGKMKKNVGTDFSYKWIQPRLTDYEMVRALLPYSRSTKNELLYLFYLLNKEAIFAPIANVEKSKAIVKLSTQANVVTSYNTNDLKILIEKYGSKDKLFSVAPGFDTFDNVNPKTMAKMAYDSGVPGLKQHSGKATRYITSSIEEKILQEIYLSNLRHRIHTFSRIVAIKTHAVPDITPFNYIELANEKDGDRRELAGIYYILSITYIYGLTNESSPMMSLILCSETDYKGMESPEGDAIQKTSSPVPAPTPTPQPEPAPEPEPTPSEDDLKKKCEEERAKALQNNAYKLDPGYNNMDMCAHSLKGYNDGYGNKDLEFSGTYNSNSKLRNGFASDSSGKVTKAYDADTTPPSMYDLDSGKFYNADPASPNYKQEISKPANAEDWLDPNNPEATQKKCEEVKENNKKIMEKTIYKTPC